MIVASFLYHLDCFIGVYRYMCEDVHTITLLLNNITQVRQHSCYCKSSRRARTLTCRALALLHRSHTILKP